MSVAGYLDANNLPAASSSHLQWRTVEADSDASSSSSEDSDDSHLRQLQQEWDENVKQCVPTWVMSEAYEGGNSQARNDCQRRAAALGREIPRSKIGLLVSVPALPVSLKPDACSAWARYIDLGWRGMFRFSLQDIWKGFARR
jgi:hypothetical protein